MNRIARLSTVVLDCSDPWVLADFYQRLTGWKPIEDSTDEWVELSNGGDLGLAFQQAPDFQPPAWPDPRRPQQFHLDVQIDESELAEAERQVIALGAGKPSHQPGGKWRVYTDPAGHPFCLCWS